MRHAIIRHVGICRFWRWRIWRLWRVPLRRWRHRRCLARIAVLEAELGIGPPMTLARLYRDVFDFKHLFQHEQGQPQPMTSTELYAARYDYEQPFQPLTLEAFRERLIAVDEQHHHHEDP